MFSPIVSAPLTCWPGSGAGSKPLYCSIERLRLRRRTRRGRPRSTSRRRLPSPSYLRALVVEAVADLVADHRADAAVVHRVVGVQVEERRLQDRGREDDLVHARVVVGVDRLRRHAPLVAVDRLAELGEVAGGLERGGARADVADQVVAAMISSSE